PFVEHNLSTNGRITVCSGTAIDGSGNSLCSYTTPPNGSYEIEVGYSGDATYSSATGVFPFTTQQATVSITLSGLASTVPGRTLSLVSNVSSASPLGTPTGSVTFVEHNLSTNGRSTPCAGTAIDGSGNSLCSYTTPPNGSYEMEVNYSGDTPNAPAIQAFPFTVSNSPVVTNISNSGPGSLRDAITFVNGNCTGGQTITFN